MEKLFKYRVSLPGIKGFARVYLLKPGTSLFAFGKLMRADMDFPQDQIVIFKAVDAQGNALARFSVKDLGHGTIDVATVSFCHKEGFDSFIYFYDTTNRKSVLVDFVGEATAVEGERYPMLVEAESKGPNPIEFEKGYIAMEDMPDDRRKRLLSGDEDEDEAFEDEEDGDELEKEEEIYGDDEEEGEE